MKRWLPGAAVILALPGAAILFFVPASDLPCLTLQTFELVPLEVDESILGIVTECKSPGSDVVLAREVNWLGPIWALSFLAGSWCAVAWLAGTVSTRNALWVMSAVSLASFVGGAIFFL